MKTIQLVTFAFLVNIAFGQKRFPNFSYITTEGKQITNQDLEGKTTMVIVGHLHCSATLFLLKDIQKAGIDTIEYLFLLENTSSQIQAFNSGDTSNAWGTMRSAFKLSPLQFPVVTSCSKERIKTKPNGTVIIKNQCNNMKFKFRALSSPTIFAVNSKGKVINKQKGWFYPSSNPKTTIYQFMTSGKNGST
jgi:hypothetical protein